MSFVNDLLKWLSLSAILILTSPHVHKSSHTGVCLVVLFSHPLSFNYVFMTMKIMTGSGALILIRLAGLWAEHRAARLPGNYDVDFGYEWQHKKIMSVILKKQWKVVARHHSSSSAERPGASITWESVAAELCQGGFSLKTQAWIRAQVTQKFWVMLSVNTSVPAPGTVTSRHGDVKRESCVLERCS